MFLKIELNFLVYLLILIIFRLPKDILEIIKEYSDVCANIVYDNVEKHKIFRKLRDYIK